MGAGGGRGDQDLKGSRLLSGLTVGAWHYTLVQTHRASNPKSDPTVNHGLCVMTMCQSGGHPSGGGGEGVDRGEAVPVMGGEAGSLGEISKSLYLPLFTVNLKQIKSITKQSCQGNRLRWAATRPERLSSLPRRPTLPPCGSQPEPPLPPALP